MTALHNRTIKLSQKRQIAENTIELTFDIDEEGILFKAGQYISLCIPSLEGARVTDRCHDFSIASSPKNASQISIAFRASESIFKKAILALPVGGLVQIDGPKGVLTLPEASLIANGQMSNVPPVIFVAGGIGITPLLSMVRYATETLSPQEIKLVYFNTSIEKIAYTSELKELEKMNVNFTYKSIVGIPNKKDFAEYTEDSSHTLWYVVGSPKMVVAVRQILSLYGILNQQIKFEEFSGI